MITKIQKWGNSQGLRISRDLLAAVDVKIGDPVEITVQRGSLVITPARRGRGGIDLEELVEPVPEDDKPGGARLGSAGRSRDPVDDPLRPTEGLLAILDACIY